MGSLRGIQAREYGAEFAICLALKFTYVFKAHFQSWTDPAGDFAPDLAFVLGPVRWAAHNANHNFITTFLNHLRLLHVHGILEDVIEAHDVETFRSNNIVVFAAFDPEPNIGLAAACT